MGKPMGAGHPMAGLAVRADLIDPFGAATRYFNTFGGNPVSARVGLAVLDVIAEEGLQQHAARTGQYLRDGLHRLAAKHDVVGDVRGAGLCLGVELIEPIAKVPDASLAARTVEQMRRRRVLLSSTGPLGNVLKSVRRYPSGRTMPTFCWVHCTRHSPRPAMLPDRPPLGTWSAPALSWP